MLPLDLEIFQAMHYPKNVIASNNIFHYSNSVKKHLIIS